MYEAEINTSLFLPQICILSATSKVHVSGISMKTILDSAKWSTNSIFQTFYLRELQQAYPDIHKDDSSSFGLIPSHICLTLINQGQYLLLIGPFRFRGGFPVLSLTFGLPSW